MMKMLVNGFVVLLSMSVLTSQADDRQYRLAFLRAEKAIPESVEALREGLREQGYVEGKNLILNVHSADGDEAKLKAIAAEVVRRKTNVIIASAPAATRAAMDATSTIPIVMVSVADPVNFKFVASLARPGGNVTGFAYLLPELSGKRLQILKEAVPRLSRVAVLWNGNNPYKPFDLKEVQAVAESLKVQVLGFPVRIPAEIDEAFKAAVKQEAEGLITLEDPFTTAHRARIVTLAQQHKLPAIYGIKPFVDAGGLMAYAPEYTHQYRRAGLVVHRILKGAKPAEIPVERPAQFEFAINQKTARAIGFSFPSSILLRADYVLE